jgi:hypothetical protein
MRNGTLTGKGVTVVCAALAVLGPNSGAGAADECLAAALNKAAADSYAFTAEERPGPGTGGPVEVRYQKGKPLWIKADGIEFFKEGEAVVYKDGERWARSKRGTESDPLRVLGALARVNAVRLPHEELAEVARALADVKRRDAGQGLTLYAGDLPQEAARRLARSEYRDVARGGAARVWVDGAGRPVRYEVTIVLRGRLGDAEVDGSVTRTVKAQGFGATEVEVPEAARKALAGR